MYIFFHLFLNCLSMNGYSKNSRISLEYCGITGCIVLIDQEVYCCYPCPSVLLLFLVEKFLVLYSCKVYVSLKLNL